VAATEDTTQAQRDELVMGVSVASAT